jgi:hypothetical protein
MLLMIPKTLTTLLLGVLGNEPGTPSITDPQVPGIPRQGLINDYLGVSPRNMAISLLNSQLSEGGGGAFRKSLWDA